MTVRENYLATVEMTGPRWIPISLGFAGAVWAEFRDDLAAVVGSHPSIFGAHPHIPSDYDNFGPAHRAGETYMDNWGCVWYSAIGGIEGIIQRHPLADLSALDSYEPPDPLLFSERGTMPDWGDVARRVAAQREAGELVSAGGGRFFERLHFLRGFDNFMADLGAEPPELPRLIDLVLQNNLKLVHKWLELGVDEMTFGDDLGSQTASMMSPATFAKWLKPGYAAMWGPCRAAGTHVYLHSDGYIMELVDHILDAGCTIINPQDLCNGIDALAAEVKGRVCIALDIDRQSVIPFGSPSEIRDLIKEEVMKLGSPAGGLMFVCGVYPGTPLRNIEALCAALEEFRTYWW